MAENTKTKIDLMPIDANIKATIEAKFAEGWVMQQIVNLQPSINKLLILYVRPPEI